LSAQEKVPKEKGSPAALIGFADALRSSPIRGSAQLAISLRSIRSDRVRALFPEWLRYSVSANGFRGWLSSPSGAAEHRSGNRGKLAPCLSAASCASAGLHEKRRGPAQRASLRDRLSFGYFSLAEQRKVSRPNGRNKKLNKYLALQGKTRPRKEPPIQNSY